MPFSLSKNQGLVVRLQSAMASSPLSALDSVKTRSTGHFKKIGAHGLKSTKGNGDQALVSLQNSMKNLESALQAANGPGISLMDVLQEGKGSSMDWGDSFDGLKSLKESMDTPKELCEKSTTAMQSSAPRPSDSYDSSSSSSSEDEDTAAGYYIHEVEQEIEVKVQGPTALDLMANLKMDIEKPQNFLALSEIEQEIASLEDLQKKTDELRGKMMNGPSSKNLLKSGPVAKNIVACLPPPKAALSSRTGWASSAKALGGLPATKSKGVVERSSQMANKKTATSPQLPHTKSQPMGKFAPTKK